VSRLLALTEQAVNGPSAGSRPRHNGGKIFLQPSQIEHSDTISFQGSQKALTFRPIEVEKSAKGVLESCHRGKRFIDVGCMG
jgi:hypothetical protein